MTGGAPAAASAMEVDGDSPPPPSPPSSPPCPRLSVDLSGDQVLRTCQEVLGHNDGKINTTVYTPEKTTKGFSLLPDCQAERAARVKQESQTVLAPSELLPPTPSIYVSSKDEAFSPQLLEFCLQKPIVLIRNLSNVCGLDMSIYSTRSLAQTHPSHPVEIRTQMEQTADENWDPTMSKQVLTHSLILLTNVVTHIVLLF